MPVYAPRGTPEYDLSLGHVHRVSCESGQIDTDQEGLCMCPGLDVLLPASGRRLFLELVERGFVLGRVCSASCESGQSEADQEGLCARPGMDIIIPLAIPLSMARCFLSNVRGQSVKLSLSQHLR